MLNLLKASTEVIFMVSQLLLSDQNQALLKPVNRKWTRKLSQNATDFMMLFRPRLNGREEDVHMVVVATPF